MRKIEEIEILRAFAILAVCAIHAISHRAISEIEDRSTFIYVFNFIIITFSHFAVPLFFLISGLILGLKYNENYSLGKYYKKRIQSIIPQYVVFSIIYAVFSYFRSPQEHPLSFSSVSFKLLTGTASAHTWFFIVLIQFYIIFPFLCKLVYKVDSMKVFMAFFIFLLIQQIGWNTFLLKFMLTPDFINVNIRNIFLSLSYVTYFILGIFISKNYEVYKDKSSKIKSVKLLSIVSILLALLSYVDITKVLPFSVYNFVIFTFTVPIYICTFILLFNLSKRIIEAGNYLKSVFIFLSEYSYGIYLIHILVLIKITDILRGAFETPYYYRWEYYLLTFTGEVVLSVILLKLLTYLPYGKLIVGIKSRKI